MDKRKKKNVKAVFRYTNGNAEYLIGSELQWFRNTQKAQNRLLEVVTWCSSAFLSLLRVFELKGTPSLPTIGLCQPYSSHEPQGKSIAPRLCKCKVTGLLWHRGFYCYLVGASTRQQPHPYGLQVSLGKDIRGPLFLTPFHSFF